MVGEVSDITFLLFDTRMNGSILPRPKAIRRLSGDEFLSSAKGLTLIR
jgi:hypothetical protein